LIQSRSVRRYDGPLSSRASVGESMRSDRSACCRAPWTGRARRASGLIDWHVSDASRSHPLLAVLPALTGLGSLPGRLRTCVYASTESSACENREWSTRFDRERGGEGPSPPGALAPQRRGVRAFSRKGTAGASVRAGGVRGLLAALAAQPSLPAEADARDQPVHGIQRTARPASASACVRA
jgi:hypothetical protein